MRALMFGMFLNLFLGVLMVVLPGLTPADLRGLSFQQEQVDSFTASVNYNVSPSGAVTSSESNIILGLLDQLNIGILQGVLNVFKLLYTAAFGVVEWIMVPFEDIVDPLPFLAIKGALITMMAWAYYFMMVELFTLRQMNGGRSN